MLQRIYGTAFASQKELDLHLERIEEAKRRDHRRVGAELGLFHLDPIAPGSPFYLPKGMIVYNGLVDFVRSLYPKYGYQEVMAPQLCPRRALQDLGPLRQVPRRHVLVRRATRARSSASRR